MGRSRHICVCICTYRRVALLAKLLRALENQRSEVFFDYSVVVVDNDLAESARSVIVTFSQQSQLRVTYCVERERNISLARNRAIVNSTGTHLAFIDDDELPGETWLLTLLCALDRYGSDGVLAPVLPDFQEQPPDWVLKGGFFDRPDHSTGHVLGWENTRTGNVLIRRDLVGVGERWFDPDLGSGGEDRDFFRRMIEQGHTFVWCSDAPVCESVPPSRWSRSVLLKRALLRGKMALNAKDAGAVSILKSIIAIPVYAVLLPFLFLVGQHVFMTYLIKLCDHLGKIMAFCGVDVVREKYVEG